MRSGLINRGGVAFDRLGVNGTTNDAGVFLVAFFNIGSSSCGPG